MGGKESVLFITGTPKSKLKNKLKRNTLIDLIFAGLISLLTKSLCDLSRKINQNLQTFAKFYRSVLKNFPPERIQPRKDANND